MDQADIRSSFLRQRRNLMAISVVNLFVSLSGIKLNELDVLGNKFTIQNPHYITASLWIAFGYWFLRYRQLLHDSGNLGIQDSFKSVIYIPTLNAIQPLFETYAEAELASRNEPNCDGLQIAHMGWNKDPSLLMLFSPRMFRCDIEYYVQDTSGAMKQKHITKDWELRPGYLLFLRSWCQGMWHILVRTSLGTEYVLPPALAVGVVIACITHALF